MKKTLIDFSSKQTKIVDHSHDEGLGTRSFTSRRLLNKDGTYNVLRRGLKYFDPYIELINLSLGQLILVLFITFVIVNALFALVYVTIGVENLSGIESVGFGGDFLNAMYFSVQTSTTVGYGAISPIGTATNIVASFDAFIGLMLFAMATGIIFARFARPGKSIIFSDVAVIGPYMGRNSFMFRLASLHNNKMIDVNADVFMTYLAEENGEIVRRYNNLQLVYRKIFMFPLNWTIVHPIDESSPLFGKTYEDIVEHCVEIVITIQGYDATYAQVVSATRSYTAESIKVDHKFKLMYEHTSKGMALHLDKIDDIEPINQPAN